MSKLTKALTAAAGNAGGDNLYVEDVFSTYLYAGDGTNPHAITNGINLADEGGLIWTKARDSSSIDNVLVDTERATGWLVSNSTGAESGSSTAYLSFNTDGYDIDNAFNNWNGSTIGDYASWTFRKAEKFFDVVSWVGSNNSATDIGKGIVAHNLGVAPAVVIVKNVTQASTNWIVYHKDQTTGYYSILNSTAAQTNSGSVSYFSKNDGGWSQTNPDADNIYIGYNYQTNGNTDTMVAYLFASDAGGFGDDGSESIIKCGSYTGNGSTDGPEIDLGFEPQFLIVKNADASVSSGTTCNWRMYDSMRGWEATGGEVARLFPNLSLAESSTGLEAVLTATGFKIVGSSGSINGNGENFIYIAIRRPMKTPESGTEVFATAQRDTTAPVFEGGFPVDAAIIADVSGAWTNSPSMGSRLTGTGRLSTSNANAEGSDGLFMWDYMNGWGNGSGSYPEYYSWMFKRATGFMDVVAYEGNSVSGRTVNHGLKVIPEFIIIKAREATRDWVAYTAPTGAGYYLKPNDTQASAASSGVFPSTPTDSVFTLGSGSFVNSTSTGAYIAYLFATLAGVSKVGSYTGTGADLNVDCGFSAGARFILIKRTDSTGDWYVWDSVRGIVAGNDPYLLLNSTAAEVTSTDYIDPLSSGFTVTSSAPAALNTSGGAYIFLAIA